MKRLINLLAICSLGTLSCYAAISETSTGPITLKSPSGIVVVTLSMVENQPFWSVQYDGAKILKPSKLGYVPEKSFENGFEGVNISTHAHNKTWKPVWGKCSDIKNHFHEVTWQLQEQGLAQRRMDIIVRAYDQGVAVRYRLYGEGEVTIKDDDTHFAFTGDYTCWSANGEHPNIGPVSLSQYGGKQFPLTVKVADDCYCSVLEAAIYDYSQLSPKRVSKNEFKSSCGKNSVTLPNETSWRVVLLGKTSGDLLTANLLVNLNPPNRIKDTSWIKPGLAMWDWRAWGGAGKDGFRYNLDMASWRRMIDFASKNNVRYLVLDANWYGHEFDAKSNPMKSRDYMVYQPNSDSPKMADRPAPKDWEDPIDIPALIKYGKQRDVGVFLYINDIARHNYDFEKTLATYHAWGAAGVKYGFMRGKGRQKVLDTRKIVDMCAKYELMCDFHDGPVPPSGDRRAYPNYVSREFCHAQADATRSFTPETFCTTVFCNMLAGPLDMCNGFLTLNGLEERPKVFKPIHSTVVAECARVLITFSGLSYLPDTPDSYEAKADLFEFISKLPMTWDETHITNASIGETITTARRSGREWFIASCCNEKGAKLPIKLDFLEAGKIYQATLYEDASDTHYINNKEAYAIRKIYVKKGDTIAAKLAPGGGHCVYVRPILR